MKTRIFSYISRFIFSMFDMSSETSLNKSRDHGKTVFSTPDTVKTRKKP